MAEPVTYAIESGVAVLTIMHRPMNALSVEVRAALMDAVDRAEEDDDVSEIVIMGGGTTFPAGGDLAELDSGAKPPYLRDLCARFDYAEKPVIAAIHGTAYGPGLELALACHYRIAVPGARASLPEVLMGLIPSGGTTQRLPRLVGAKLALDMMLSGGVVALDRPPGQQLIDAQGGGDLREAAVRFALALRSRGAGARPMPPRREGFADPAAYQAELSARHKTISDPDSAAGKILHLVESAQLLPFDVGCEMEGDLFDEALASEAASALRYSFSAERTARRVGRRPRALPPLQRIAVLGPGPLAMQITYAALRAGLAVNWGAKDVARLTDSVSRLREMFPGRAGAQAPLSNLRTGESAEMVVGADLILHAARGQGDVPAPPGVPRLPVMPGQVVGVGLRFAMPAMSNKLVELIETEGAELRDVAFALALSERLGKLPLRVRSRGESVVQRLTAALMRAADGLVEMGDDPYRIDAAVEDWGWQRPPFRSRDMMGLEAIAGLTAGHAATCNWSEKLVKTGRTGWASGRGFYDWGGEGARESAAVTELLDAARPLASAERTQEDTVALLLGAMANEGLRILDDGLVSSVAEIDVAALLALDMPRGRGGVMKAVSRIGLFSVMKQMERLGHPDQRLWAVGPRWRDLVKNGQDFDAL